LSQKKDTTVYKALQCRQESLGNKSCEETIPLELIGEEPFLINIDEKPYSVE